MVTKTDYSVQLQGAQGVASADPSSAIRATQLTGQAVSQGLQLAGTTIFDAYQGYQEEGVRQEQQSMFDDLKGEFDSLKSSEIANNATFEQSAKDAPALEAFKKEQERIGQAVLQMPERAAEWRMRSSKALREAIARNPGMANSFRQVTQQITGLKDLDMYSVTNLYDEIDAVAKRQEVAQKAQAKAYEDGLKRYLDDVKDIMSQTEGAASYAAMSDQERLQVTTDAFKTKQRIKAFEESLKQGGTAISNGITNLIAAADTGNVAIMNGIRQKIKSINIDENLLVTGQLSDADKNNPELKTLLSKAASTHRNYIESEFQRGNTMITAALQNGNVDPTAARQAREDLQKWRDKRIDEVEKNGAIKVLGALVGGDENDPQKTLDTRLRTVNLLMSSFNIPADIANLITSGGDDKRIDKIARDNPTRAFALRHLQELRNAALRGVSNEEWMSLVKKGGELRSSPTIPIPKTRDELTATFIETEDAAKKMKDSAMLGQSDAPSTLKVISSAMALKDTAEKVLKEYPTALQRQLSLIPASEKGAFEQQVKGSYENVVYGSVGHGDVAFNRLEQAIPQYARNNAKLVMLDSTGATPLKMGSVGRDTKVMSNYSSVSLTGPDEVNKALASVDSAIRVYAMVTNQDVRKLRQEFIQNFQKGKPSDVYTSAVSGDAITAATKGGEGNGATKEPSKKPLVSDWLSQ